MARHRYDGGMEEFKALKSDHQRKVLLEVANNGGRIFRACKAIGISPFVHFGWKRSDPAYRKAFEIADDLGTEKLIELLKDEIVDPHRKGEVGPNILAAMFAIKAKRPEYRDNFNPFLAGGNNNITINVINYHSGESNNVSNFDSLTQSAIPPKLVSFESSE